MTSNNGKTMKLAQAALLAALCYIGFMYMQFPIAVGTEKTAIHFGNTFCVLAALLLGGVQGGLAGAVGMTLADLTSSYATSAPKTFLLKLCIGVIVGLVAHKIAKLSESHEKSYVFKWSLLASMAGMIFNVFADPIVGYYYKRYILGLDADLAAAFAKMSSITTFINAVTSIILATTLYCALRPVLTKAGLYHSISRNNAKSRSHLN